MRACALPPPGHPDRAGQASVTEIGDLLDSHSLPVGFPVPAGAARGLARTIAQPASPNRHGRG